MSGWSSCAALCLRAARRSWFERADGSFPTGTKGQYVHIALERG